MQVIQNQTVTTLDWQLIGAEETVPASGDIIVPLALYQEQRDVFTNHTGQIGVLIPSDVSVDELADSLDAFALIAVEMGKYPDGRAFSQARLLRDKYHYQGDILAVGDMLRDQLPDLVRCGVNLIAFTESRDAQDALASFNEFSVHYQPPAADGLVIGVLS